MMSCTSVRTNNPGLFEPDYLNAMKGTGVRQQTKLWGVSMTRGLRSP
jgi:hypothetical protein